MLIVQPTDADHEATQRLPTCEFRRQAWLPYGPLIAVGALASAGVFSRRFVDVGAVSTLVMVAALLFMLVARHANAPRWRRDFAQHKTAHRAISYDWNEHVLSPHREYGDTKVPWTDFFAVRENEEVFLLYCAKRLFYCIRFFSDPASIADFGAPVRAKIGGTAMQTTATSSA